MGHVRFAVFYLLCGLAAAAGQIVADPDSAIPMVGASGAIGGVMGAYIVLYPRVHVHIPRTAGDAMRTHLFNDLDVERSTPWPVGTAARRDGGCTVVRRHSSTGGTAALRHGGIAMAVRQYGGPAALAAWWRGGTVHLHARRLVRVRSRARVQSWAEVRPEVRSGGGTSIVSYGQGTARGTAGSGVRTYVIQHGNCLGLGQGYIGTVAWRQGGTV